MLNGPKLSIGEKSFKRRSCTSSLLYVFQYGKIQIDKQIKCPAESIGSYILFWLTLRRTQWNCTSKGRCMMHYRTKYFSAKHLKVQLESGKLTDSVTGSALLIKYRFRILFELRNFTFQLIIQHEQQQSNRSGNRSFSLLSNRAIASNTKAILNRYFIVIWFRDVQNIKLQFKSHTLFFDCQFMIFSQN